MLKPWIPPGGSDSHGTALRYGQTGAGKTYTLYGTPQEEWRCFQGCGMAGERRSQQPLALEFIGSDWWDRVRVCFLTPSLRPKIAPESGD